MAVAVLMPTFGMTEGEAVILRWLKAVGEPVAADEPLFEAETDKATLEVPAPCAGTLAKIEAEPGQTVPYRAVVAWIAAGDEGAASADAGGSGADALPAAGAVQGDSGAGEDWVPASPLARRVAFERGLDLRGVPGSGPGGRVVEADVQQALAERETASTLSHGPQPERLDLPPLPPQVPESEGVPPGKPAAGLGTRLPLSAARLITAERMTASFSTAPHFYLQVEVRATGLVRLRLELLPEIERIASARLSYSDLLLRAMALLLPRHALMNATWAGDGVVTYSHVNLGIAVAAPGGLVVPVIRDAVSLSLPELARKRSALVGAARAGSLGPADMAGGTCTLSNLGSYGIDGFLPILNPPQSAILAAGAIADRPAALNGQIVLQPTMHLSLAVDHRVADGSQAAEFLRDLRELLEAPSRMML